MGQVGRRKFLITTGALVRPITGMSVAADKISVGQLDIPELSETGRNEVSLLAKSSNRVRRSLEEAITMIDEK